MMKNFFWTLTLFLSLVYGACKTIEGSTEKKPPIAKIIDEKKCIKEIRGLKNKKQILFHKFSHWYPSPSNVKNKELKTQGLRAKKSDHQVSKIDIEVFPLDEKAQKFKNFKDFNAFVQDQQNSLLVLAFFRSFIHLIEFLGLDKNGYRIVFEEFPDLAQGFYFRIFGGEPLGDTVQLNGEERRRYKGRVRIDQKYSADNSFSEHLSGSNNIPQTHCDNGFCSLIFKDIDPQAKVHMLSIPKGHYVSSYDFFKEANICEIRSLFFAVDMVTKGKVHLGFGPFRFITNAGINANQWVPHFHIHVVRGGRLPKEQLGPKAIVKYK